MTVFGADGRQLGRVEKLRCDQFMVNGRRISQSGVSRVTREGVYLAGDGAMQSGDDAGEIRVQVAEERLSVGKREVDLGAVELRKTVTEEQVTVPIALRRDEVRIQTVAVVDRPLRADDDAFTEGTIRVPLRGEEAVVAKEAVVTGEVVIAKEIVAEERTVGDTIRKERVEIDQTAVRETSPAREPGRDTRKGRHGE